MDLLVVGRPVVLDGLGLPLLARERKLSGHAAHGGWTGWQDGNRDGASAGDGLTVAKVSASHICVRNGIIFSCGTLDHRRARATSAGWPPEPPHWLRECGSAALLSAPLPPPRAIQIRPPPALFSLVLFGGRGSRGHTASRAGTHLDVGVAVEILGRKLCGDHRQALGPEY